MRKPVSLSMCVVQGNEGRCNQTLVICDDGSMWRDDGYHGAWHRIADIPQDIEAALRAESHSPSEHSTR